MILRVCGAEDTIRFCKSHDAHVEKRAKNTQIEYPDSTASVSCEPRRPYTAVTAECRI